MFTACLFSSIEWLRISPRVAKLSPVIDSSLKASVACLRSSFWLSMLILLVLSKGLNGLSKAGRVSSSIFLPSIETCSVVPEMMTSRNLSEELVSWMHLKSSICGSVFWLSGVVVSSERQLPMCTRGKPLSTRSRRFELRLSVLEQLFRPPIMWITGSPSVVHKPYRAPWCSCSAFNRSTLNSSSKMKARCNISMAVWRLRGSPQTNALCQRRETFAHAWQNQSFLRNSELFVNHISYWRVKFFVSPSVTSFGCFVFTSESSNKLQTHFLWCVAKEVISQKERKLAMAM